METLHPGGDGTITTTASNGQDLAGPDRQQLAQVVYQSLKSDQKLSDAACNVVVVSQNDTVTLNGSVPSQEMKQAMEAKATEIASNSGASVVNHLSVDPNEK
jgi:osmotically-inducible protein OsmY